MAEDAHGPEKAMGKNRYGQMSRQLLTLCARLGWSHGSGREVASDISGTLHFVFKPGMNHDIELPIQQPTRKEPSPPFPQPS
jgi:hypothetical protein